MTRAAEILGIDEETLSNAFQQATQEMMTERQQEWLQNAVENGLTTEEEGADVQEWRGSKPDCLEGSCPFGGQRSMGGGNQSMGRGPMGEPNEDYAFSAP